MIRDIEYVISSEGNWEMKGAAPSSIHLRDILVDTVVSLDCSCVDIAFDTAISRHNLFLMRVAGEMGWMVYRH